MQYRLLPLFVVVYHNLDGKNLLLITLYTWIAEHREISLELTRKPSLCWLAFTVLERAVQLMGKERHQRFLPVLYPAHSCAPVCVLSI